MSREWIKLLLSAWIIIWICCLNVSTNSTLWNGASVSDMTVDCLDPASCTFSDSVLPSDDLPQGFHFIFVDASGNKSKARGLPGTQVEIAGSPMTSLETLIVAADFVAKMTKYMPVGIFYELAKSSSVGVFTASEKLVVYPEFSHLTKGSCGSSCEGSCSSTCSKDGRKIEDIYGMTGSRAVVLDDNVLCSHRDPYRGKHNILSHEFTHTIHSSALPESIKQKIKQAYIAAKSKATWSIHSYAMLDEYEYFAEGGSVFFNCNLDLDTSGGMSTCGKLHCASEQEARQYLLEKDPALFSLLSFVFTDNRPGLKSGLTLCP